MAVCLSDGVLTLCSCSGYSFHITAALDYPEESNQSFIAQLLGLNVYSVCSNATGYYKVFYMEFFFSSSSNQLIYQQFRQTSNLFRLAMTRPQGDFIIQLITFFILFLTQSNQPDHSNLSDGIKCSSAEERDSLLQDDMN